MLPWRTAAVTGGYLVAWLALDFFGYVIRVAPGIGIWNPAHGLSLALVCVFGPRTIPLLLVGPLLNGWMFWTPDDPVAVVAQALSVTIGYGIAGWMLHARGTDARLESLPDGAAFLGTALFGSVIAAGLCGAAGFFTGSVALDSLTRGTIALWAGDMLGILGLGPFFLRAMLWVKTAPYEGHVEQTEGEPRHRPRVGLIALQVAVTLLVVAASPYRWGVLSDSPTQLILICVVWIALTHGAAGAAVAIVGVNLAMLLVKQFGAVPLTLQDEQILLAAVGITGILAGAAVSESRRRARQLAQNRTELDRHGAVAAVQKEIETNLVRAQEIAGMGSYRWEAATGEVWWSDKFYRLLGVEPGSLVPGPTTFHDFVHPDDRSQMDRLTEDIRGGRIPGTVNIVRVIRRDGQLRRFRLAREIEIGPDGRASRIFGVVQDITEEFETSRALRENRERGAAVAVHMPGAVFQNRVTRDGAVVFTYMSEGVRRQFGVSPEDAIARADALLDAIHPDDRLVFRLAIENAAKSAAPWRQEFRVLAPGGVTWVRGAAQVRTAEDGELVWDGVLLDITAEKSAAEELKRSEERFRRIASDAPMAICIFGAEDGLVRFANRACEEMFGYGVGDLRGVATRTITAEWADAAKFRAELRRSGTVSNREVRVRRRDGTQFWGIFSLMTLGVTDSDEVLACGFDSTELRNARSELSRQANDLAGRIRELRCLYAIARLTNDSQRTAEDICRELVDVLPQGLRVPRQVSVRIALRGMEFMSDPFRNGGARLVHEIVADGQAVGEIEVALDADTTQVPASFLDEERELVETTAMHIGRMVAERDLAERLVQAQKLESLGQLTGGIAHDFNNLLAIMFGNLELGESQCGSNVTLHKCITNAMHAARRAADLTAQLQAFSRRQALLPIKVQLNELVSAMLLLLRSTLGEQIKVATELAPTPTPIRIDPSRMEAALLAMAVNARDAMPSGGGLTISTRLAQLAADAGKELAAGTYVELSIADTGTGMAPDVARRVFEPFFTTKDVGKGSGLGLATVFGFLKQSGGHIEVESEMGKGSIFRLYVPLLDEREDAERAEAAKRDVSDAGESILVVEDEPEVLDFVARMLRTSGYRVLTANDGAQALEIIRGGSACNLMLADVGLPGGMSGVELTRAARDIDPGLKVILASGYAHEYLEKSGAFAEGLPVLFKPFVRRELLSRLRATLDGAPDAQQNGSMEAVA